jgi:hypothetical protein
MPEVNTPPCPTHGALPRSLHAESFEGIVTVIEEIINTVSGVGDFKLRSVSLWIPL